MLVSGASGRPQTSGPGSEPVALWGPLFLGTGSKCVLCACRVQAAWVALRELAWVEGWLFTSPPNPGSSPDTVGGSRQRETSRRASVNQHRPGPSFHSLTRQARFTVVASVLCTPLSAC